MKTLLMQSKRSLYQLSLGLFMGGLSALTARPVLGAEQVSLSYGILQKSISIDTIENYATTGQLDGALMSYAHRTTPEQLAQLQQVLTIRIPLNSEHLTKFLYTYQGEQFLHKLSVLIQPDASRSSMFKVRSALIRASDSPDGLTFVNVLRQFPGKLVEIDLSAGLQLLGTWRMLANRTNQAVVQVDKQAQLEVATKPLPWPLPSRDLQRQGYFTWEFQTLTLSDRTRNRTFPVDLYLPLDQRPYPVIVISHGLGADRTTLAYLAQHLASYGFAVALPEHPGSNWKEFQAFLEGQSDKLVSAREFLDRPLDVSYLLDQLSELTQSDPHLRGRLNVNQVGVIGQSYGGYTALALAGAIPHFEQLRSICPNWQNTLNASLMLQCEAKSLPNPTMSLADSRVKAVIAINPVGSQIFGPEGLSYIRTPVLMAGGSVDTVAQVLFEQIEPFGWLTTSHKYLAIIHGGTHLSSLAPVNDPTVDPLWGENPKNTRQYIMALSTAFLSTYVANYPRYQSYLSAAYAQKISRASSSLSLVQSLPSSTAASISHPLSMSSLILIGASTQLFGFIYFIRTRKRSQSVGNSSSDALS